MAYINPGVASDRADRSIRAAQKALRKGDCGKALRYATYAQKMSNICGCDGLIEMANQTAQRAASCNRPSRKK
jgi:hypothetical protein